MSTQIISQVLSPENATYINGVSAERRFSAATLKNLYQGLVEKGNRGVSDKFVTEDDAQSSAQVFVNRVLPVKMSPREAGSNKNGAGFSANKHYIQTETVGINILTVLDDPIIIPRITRDQIRVDLLAEQVEIYSNRLKTILNGATFASKVLGWAIAKSKGEGYNEVEITANDVTNKLIYQRFVEGNSKLDEGDEEHGIDLFPDDTKIAVFKPSYRPILKGAGVLVIGGANYAYDIAKNGGLNPDVQARKLEDGYIGDLDDVPCHIISNESLTHAAEFCGFPAGEFKGDKFIGYISSSWANARGVSTANVAKIVDAQDGQGLVFQPYTKFGVASWYPKGNVILVKDASYSPVAGLKTLFSSVAADITFKVKGAGSRLYATGGTWTVATTGFTLANVACLDDWNADKLKGAYYKVSTKELTTVGDFLAESATYKGAVTIGTAVSTTIADGDYVNVLVIAEDGTCSILSKKYTA